MTIILGTMLSLIARAIPPESNTIVLGRAVLSLRYHSIRHQERSLLSYSNRYGCSLDLPHEDDITASRVFFREEQLLYDLDGIQQFFVPFRSGTAKAQHSANFSGLYSMVHIVSDAGRLDLDSDSYTRPIITFEYKSIDFGKANSAKPDAAHLRAIAQNLCPIGSDPQVWAELLETESTREIREFYVRYIIENSVQNQTYQPVFWEEDLFSQGSRCERNKRNCAEFVYTSFGTQ
jgi:hypothetical protein